MTARTKPSRARIYRIGVADYRKAEATLHVAAAATPSYLASERDLPEPDWWPVARYMAKQGMSYRAIGRALNKNDRTVRYALDPAFRLKRNAERGNSFMHNGSMCPDYKRRTARQIARERWREGGKKRALKWYYRDLDCM